MLLFLLGVHVCADILVLHYTPFLTSSRCPSSHFCDLLKRWTEYHLWAEAKGQWCHFVIRFSNLWAEFNNRVHLFLQPWLFLAIHLFLLLLTCKNRLTTPRYLGSDAGGAGWVILYLQSLELWMRAQIGTQCLWQQPCHGRHVAGVNQLELLTISMYAGPMTVRCFASLEWGWYF